ncbi:O-acetyl-ADP-ribose deacetylase MACROD2 [Liparis tanakae]|uniref:O-acetyl-ADP-ribose deacetylase MACROD2 n=1 Tax=Liparis tanakae TaxID=230148 RepID=A0A4Z2I910_9TELE|nr:O-acetyl-ADP-ribose deacetylase MACROD2 [Liparis tanakae]
MTGEMSTFQRAAIISDLGSTVDPFLSIIKPQSFFPLALQSGVENYFRLSLIGSTDSLWAHEERKHDVIHTVGPVARGHVGPTETNDLTSCYQNSLRLMKEHELSTVESKECEMETMEQTELGPAEAFAFPEEG